MKIALIEDRISRLNQFADQEIKKSPILDIISEEKFTILLSKIVSKDYSNLDKYNCLLFHRSALENKERQSLSEYCNVNNKPLVFFSGSISSSNYRDKEFPFLYINSKDFYSENLLTFLKQCEIDDEVNLLILQFGYRWKLNQLLKLRNRLNLNLNTGKISRIRNFELVQSVREDLKNRYNLRWLDQPDLTEVSIENILELKSKLNLLINDSL